MTTLFAINRKAPALDRVEAQRRAIAEEAPAVCEWCGAAGRIGHELVIDSLYSGTVGNPVVACKNTSACWRRLDQREAY